MRQLGLTAYSLWCKRTRAFFMPTILVGINWGASARRAHRRGLSTRFMPAAQLLTELATVS